VIEAALTDNVHVLPPTAGALNSNQPLLVVVQSQDGFGRVAMLQLSADIGRHEPGFAIPSHRPYDSAIELERHCHAGLRVIGSARWPDARLR